MDESAAAEQYETDFTMSDASVQDVARALTSPDALPFFMEEVRHCRRHRHRHRRCCFELCAK
jgi:hypothetical protein